MKIKGKKVTEPNIEVIIIPRGDGQEDIIFKAAAIMDMSGFEKALPRPTPPKVITKNGPGVNQDDPDYLRALNEWASRKIAWMVMTSLQATEDLEWEQAKLGDPNTWHLYDKELTDSGFSDHEKIMIVNGVYAANCMSTERLSEARQRFLLSQALEKDGSSSQEGGLNSTLSGELANASASVHQASQTAGTK